MTWPDVPGTVGTDRTILASSAQVFQGYPNRLPRFPGEPTISPIRILAPSRSETISREHVSKNPIASIRAARRWLDCGCGRGLIRAHRASSACAGVATICSAPGMPTDAHLHAWRTRTAPPQTQQCARQLMRARRSAIAVTAGGSRDRRTRLYLSDDARRHRHAHCLSGSAMRSPDRRRSGTDQDPFHR